MNTIGKFKSEQFGDRIQTPYADIETVTVFKRPYYLAHSFHTNLHVSEADPKNEREFSIGSTKFGVNFDISLSRSHTSENSVIIIQPMYLFFKTFGKFSIIL